MVVKTPAAQRAYWTENAGREYWTWESCLFLLPWRVGSEASRIVLQQRTHLSLHGNLWMQELKSGHALFEQCVQKSHVCVSLWAVFHCGLMSFKAAAHCFK